MNKLSETVTRLRSIIKDPNCERMNRSSVKGFLGELLIKQKLESEDLYVELHGNQSGYDLSFAIGHRRFRIDVKTSLPQNDKTSLNQDYWEWALLHENKKREIKATHIVCLACDNECSPSFFIVIPLDRVNKFPNCLKKYSKVKHGLIATTANACNFKNDGLRKCTHIMAKNNIKAVPFDRSLRKEISP